MVFVETATRNRNRNIGTLLIFGHLEKAYGRVSLCDLWSVSEIYNNQKLLVNKDEQLLPHCLRYLPCRSSKDDIATEFWKNIASLKRKL